jgi:hypothetical protein
MRRIWVWGLVLASVACQLGGRVNRFAPANQPAGVRATLWLIGGGTGEGELLAVQDTAFILFDRDTVTLVPYRVLRAGRFSQIGDFTDVPPATGVMRKLRLASRFPQGLSPDLLAQLLAAYGQSALKVRER